MVSSTISNKAFQPIDNAFLVLFRAIFGLLIMLECWGAIATGWVKRAFIVPKWTFPFIDFADVLHPLPGWGMYAYFVVMGGLGLLIFLGYQYRSAMPAFALLWAGVYLMQKTHYNNHYYLLMLMSCLMCFVPAHARLSIDAKHNPDIRSNTCPKWCRFLFLGQMILVYTYGGIAKMYDDWWQLDAIAALMLGKKNYWLVGELLQTQWMHAFLAYGGLFFDLLISPLLLWKPSRKWAFYALIFFHLFNAAIFQVGIFPFLGIAMCLFYYPPDALARFVPRWKIEATTVVWPWKKPVVVLLMVYLTVQALLPLRHHLFSGDVNITNEGHRLAWRMMLRTRAGRISMEVRVQGEEAKVLNLSEYLTLKQKGKVATHPDMLWQFVQNLEQDFDRHGKPNVDIYVTESAMSLNGADYKPLYQTNVNLADVPWHKFKTSDWILR